MTASAAEPPSSQSARQAEDHLLGFWTHCGLPERRWAEALDAYRRYWRLIERHNRTAGLMGKLTEADFYLKHVADSLAALLAWGDLLERASGLADAGAGAGLPGIVLALALPQLHLTAIESNHVKADFIAAAAEALGLGGRVQVLARRSRELGHLPECRRRFEVVTARAVAPAEKLIREVRLLIAPGGSAILYKTPGSVAAELAVAQRECGKHGLSLETSSVIELPTGTGSRQFIRAIAPR